MPTIGQVASYLGVTNRAIRHYHQRGLLPESEHDLSGYRRYTPDAILVLALVRIKTLSDTGIPPARIEQLMAAGTDEFAASIVSIDAETQQQVRELKQRRKRIAESGEDDPRRRWARAGGGGRFAEKVL
ncbi:MerR family transcriptional regulator [Catenulispora sp. NL8]|uniref:MerR family transcriptional regulator n=1 Tax=Catenulispora pinistramenti TaxID=2705254 RepID=A0ABS5KK75_9ACTN|nr:MerR family transcriptional regulator [Catenulispora pinistramenti]MBS2546575.1 MerR family transcriptional regulator [Catenulispora pinistramenti]